MAYSRKLKLVILVISGTVLFVLGHKLWINQAVLLSPFLTDAMTDSPHKPLTTLLKEKGVINSQDLWVEIAKSKHTLIVYNGVVELKKYNIALGKDCLHDKEKDGDGGTPVGEFKITETHGENSSSLFSGARYLLLNYPRQEDAFRGINNGLITSKDFLAIEKAEVNYITPPQGTPLGGNVAIHGGGTPLLGDSWTNGSVGMYNKDFEELYGILPMGTKVVIRK